MVKYIGADKQGTANDTFKAPGISPQSLNGSDKSFQFAQAQQQQLGESLKGSLQFQSQTAARMSEDFSRTNSQAAQSASQSLQASASSGNGFSQAMGNLANVGNMIVQTLDNRSKQEAAQAKAVRENNASTMWDRVSQWEVDAPAKARLDPGGTVTLRNEAAQLFATTEGSDLLPEDREKLMKHVFGNVIAGLSSKNVEDLMTQQRKLQETNINTRKERAVFESSSLLSSLGAATTQEEQATAITKLSTYLGAVATSRDLDPMSKAEIQLGLTTQMNKAMFTSEENRLKAQEVITNYNTFQQDVAEARSKYPNDPESQETAIAYSAFRNKIPSSIADKYDSLKAQKLANERIETNNKSRDLRSEEVARSLGVASEDTTEAGFDAERYDNKAKLQALAQVLGGGDASVGVNTPKYKQVVAAQEVIKEYRNLIATTNERTAQLQLQKDKIAAGDAQTNIEYLKTLKPSPQADDLLNQVRLANSNNPQVLAYLPMIAAYQNADAVKKAEYDNALAQAYGLKFNSSEAVTRSIDAEYQAIQQRKYILAKEVAGYGFDIDGVFNKNHAKRIEERRLKEEAERQARENERYYNQGSQGGTTTGAPFDGGTSYFNGLEVFNEQEGLIMPITKAEIKRQGKANINEGVGYRAWAGRQHNGQDIGLDLGTPIVAQLDGKVTRVWGESDSGAGSSGNTVEITYPDGSSHVFMHLSERSSLTVGQRVKAGQVVGKAGNTGLAGGNANVGNVHLHWEVWYGEQRSTPQEWSTKYRKMMESAPKQPRGGGPGASVTAPVRGTQGVPIKGGVLLPDGKGGASVASYSGTTALTIGVDYLTRNKISTPEKVSPTEQGMYRAVPIANSQLSVVTLYKPDGTKQGVYTVPSSTKLIAGNRPDYTNKLTLPYETVLGEINSLNTVTTRKNSMNGLRDNGQQKQRPSVPSANKGDYINTFLGPGGVRFGTDSKGNLVRVPDPVGVSSRGVSSSSGGYSSANPLRNLTNSNRASDYNLNDVTNDHGFKALKSNPSAARTINEVARDFGVPGEWLAEVVSVETGNTFDPNQKEYGGSGATGLIQFYPDHDGGSTKTINGRVYNLSDIGRMSIEQQLRGPVKDYLKEAMASNGMKRIPTIQDLYSLVWAYGPASKARNMRDIRGPSGSTILERLGKFSGRKYSSNTNTSTNIAQADTYSSDRTSKLTQSVDQRPRSGCLTCTKMVASNMFVPHERVNLNTGMNTFNLA